MRWESQNNGLVQIGIHPKFLFDDSEVTAKLDKIGFCQIRSRIEIFLDIDVRFGKEGKQSRLNFQLIGRWVSACFVYSQFQRDVHKIKG